MRRVLRGVGTVLAILVITLALDFVLTATLFAGIKRAMTGAAENHHVYRPVSYHHDLLPDVRTTRIWGNILFPWATDRYGFRTGECAPGETEKTWKPIFVIGDSFTEGVGSTYEKSFVGLMACDAARQKKAVWHLGVTSYSPTIYFRKIAAAVERLGVRPAEIFVFLDMSDIDDEANAYKPEGDIVYSVTSPKPPPKPPEPQPANQPPPAAKPSWPRLPPIDFGQFLENNFTSVRLAYDLYLLSTFSYRYSLDRPRARWSLDPALMEAWGKRGLEIAAANLDRIVAQCREWSCRLTLVVYPWPDNVAAGDREGIQVRYWRDWSAGRGVRFIDGYAPFFREDAYASVRKHFILGDVHFSEGGHRAIFEEVKKAVGGDW